MKSEPLSQAKEQADLQRIAVFKSAAEVVLSSVSEHIKKKKQPKMQSDDINKAADLVVSKLCEESDGPHLELNKKQRAVLRNQIAVAVKATNSEMLKAKDHPTSIASKLAEIEQGGNLSGLKGAAQSLNKACEYVIGVQSQDQAELEKLEKKVHRSGADNSDFIVQANSKNAADKMMLLMADALKREPRPYSTLNIVGIGEITRKDAQGLLTEQFLFSGVRMFFTHPIRTTMQALGLVPGRDSITRELSEQLGLSFVREGENASVKLMHPDFAVSFNIFQSKMKENGDAARFTKDFKLLSELFTNQESYTQIRNLMEANADLKGILPKYSKFIGNSDQMMVGGFRQVFSNVDSQKALLKYFQDKNLASLQKDPSSYNTLSRVVPGALPEITAFNSFKELKETLEKTTHPEVTKFMSEQLFNKRDFDEILYGLDNFNNISLNPDNELDISKMWQTNLARQIQTVADGMRHNRIVKDQTPDQQLKSLEEYADNLLELLARPDAEKYYGQLSVKKMVDDINAVRDDIINSIYNSAENNISDIIVRMGKVGLAISVLDPEAVKLERHVERVASQVSINQQQQVI